MDFFRHKFAEPNQTGKEQAPGATWDYFDGSAIPEEHRRFYADAIAFGTCPKGHTCQLSSKVHSIAGDGTLTPSYVCPVAGCGFHEYVRFVGWGMR